MPIAQNYLCLISPWNKDVSTISRNILFHLSVKVQGGSPQHLHHLSHGQLREETFSSSSSFSGCRCFKTEAAGATLISMGHAICHSLCGPLSAPQLGSTRPHSTRTSAPSFCPCSGQRSVSNYTEGNPCPELFNPPQHFPVTHSFVL